MKIRFNVVKCRTLYFIVSISFVALAFCLLLFKGFNLGIDFESGLSMTVQIESSQEIKIDELRASLSSFEGARVQNIGDSDNNQYQIRVKLNKMEQRDAESYITGLIASKVGQVTILGSSFIGAKFSASMITGAVKAVSIALVLILIYVWLRFRMAYAIGSILALVHDVTLMLGFISLVGFEITSTSIAAVLTIIGYSLNNTIVIFDRIRESISRDRTAPLERIIDDGVNSSLTRTTYSSVTTLVAVVPLAILASGDVQSFAICMIFGVVVGTFSSNFLASNILYFLGNKESMDIRKEKEKDDMSDEALAKGILGED